MTAEDSLESLRKEISNHKRFRRMRQVFDEMSVWDADSLHDEVLRYQNERGNRPADALQRQPKKKVIAYASEDASLRSRITYIQVQTRRLSYRLETLITVLHDWVLAEYGNRLKGTVQIKKAFIADLGSFASVYSSKLNALDDCCSIVLADIDQSQWSRKAVVQILEIQSRPEGKI